eukprot:jgi/Bigna1/19524/gw1.54.11.1
MDGEGNVSTELTYSQVWQKATAVAEFLKNAGVEEGERIVLCYEFNLEFIQAFLGCLIAGAVAVPIYPPNPSKLKYRWFQPMNKHSQQPYSVHYISKALSSWLTSSRIAARNGTEEEGKCKEVLAFLQYTSGTTGDPKGVMVPYSSLMHNLILYHQMFETMKRAHHHHHHNGEGDSDQRYRPFCWLPQYHDFGLICNYLLVFFVGSSGCFMSPFDFVRCPPLWLHGLWKMKCNATNVPNFAFKLVLRKWNTRPVPHGFHLRNLIGIGAGGEANIPRHVEEFERFFSFYGMKGGTVSSSYGLAEHVVTACSDSNIGGRSYSKRTNDHRHHRLCIGVFNHPRSSKFNGVLCKIVDPDTCLEVPKGSDGEIWLSSPSVALGYWGLDPVTSKATSSHIASRVSWLRTGDLGFMEDNKLFYVSRLKDVIIVRGKNYAPKDFETAADAVEGIRPGCTIAFSVQGREVEQVVMVSEV